MLPECGGSSDQVKRLVGSSAKARRIKCAGGSSAQALRIKGEGSPDQVRRLKCGGSSDQVRSPEPPECTGRRSSAEARRISSAQRAYKSCTYLIDRAGMRREGTSRKRTRVTRTLKATKHSIQSGQRDDRNIQKSDDVTSFRECEMQHANSWSHGFNF